MMRRTLIAALLWLTCTSASMPGQTASLHADDAWMRQPPRSSTMAAAYAVIVNDTEHPVSIVSATGTGLTTVELHEMSMRDGMMHMGRLDKVVVPARGRLKLASSGIHLMLFGIARPLAVGDALNITLRTADGRDIPVRIDVRAPDFQP